MNNILEWIVRGLVSEQKVDNRCHRVIKVASHGQSAFACAIWIWNLCIRFRYEKVYWTSVQCYFFIQFFSPLNFRSKSARSYLISSYLFCGRWLKQCEMLIGFANVISNRSHCIMVLFRLQFIQCGCYFNLWYHVVWFWFNQTQNSSITLIQEI